MTQQKKKAQELIRKFTFARTDDHENYVAKQCALTTVQEIIKALEITTGHCNLRKIDRQEVQSDFAYWEQVKKEITLL